MKKKYLIVPGFILCLGLGWFWWSSNAPDAGDGDAEVVNTDAASTEAMSIKGMEIRQGENGVELWHLKADSAIMSQQGGDIVAERPVLTYYFSGTDADGALPAKVKTQPSIITVQSASGDVNQKDNRMRFLGDVVARHDEDRLETAVIVYEGGQHKLLCPEFSILTRPGMRGEANYMIWDLMDNTLHAKNGVNIDIETTRSPGEAMLGQ